MDRNLVIIFTLLMLGGCFESRGVRLSTEFDSQGHRGARGVYPENTLAGFAEAVNQGMRTLELDLAVSKDSILMVSHEPWFNEAICELANTGYSANTSLYTLSAAEISKVDCGSKGNLDYPQQQAMLANKPTLSRVVSFADSLATANGRSLPHYNIEIKSKPSWDGEYTPAIEHFVELVVEFISSEDLKNRSNIQSFDLRPLQLIKALDQDIQLALLSAKPLSWTRQVEELGFRPDIYSPYHLLLRPETVDAIHDEGIHVIPWTVNDVTRMSTLMDWGVDGIITDYPKRLAEVAR